MTGSPLSSRMSSFAVIWARLVRNPVAAMTTSASCVVPLDRSTPLGVSAWIAGSSVTRPLRIALTSPLSMTGSVLSRRCRVIAPSGGVASP